MSLPEQFIYTENDERRELQEKEIPVVNFMQEQGVPSRESLRLEMLSGVESVETHFEPFREKEVSNVIYGLPHAGELAPKDIYDRMTDEGRETLPLIDVGTPEIFRSQKIPSVETKMSRFIVDPNRAPDFTPDGQTVEGKPPGKILWKEGVRFGSMYQEGLEPDESEIKKLAEQFYLPYYNKMMAGIGMLTDRRSSPNQRVLVLDGHSFPITENMKSYFDHYKITDPEKLPLFILGTRDGESADSDIVEAFAESLDRNFKKLPFEQQELIRSIIKGDIVGLNDYLKGVHNVKFYGARDQGVNAIQVECNELGYVDRDAMQNMPGYQRWSSFRYNSEKMSILRGVIEQSALDIDPILKKK